MEFLIKLFKKSDIFAVRKNLIKIFDSLQTSIILFNNKIKNYSSFNDFENNILSNCDNVNLLLYLLFLNNKIIGFFILKRDGIDKKVYLIEILTILSEHQKDELILFLINRAVEDLAELEDCVCLKFFFDTDNIKILNYKKIGFINSDNNLYFHNYLPLILKNISAKFFFDKYNWHDSINEINFNNLEYYYNFVCNEEYLNIVIDSNKMEIKSVKYHQSPLNKNLNFKIDFTELHGKNIKIAVIDSGIDYNHPGIKQINDGVKFFLNNKRKICFDKNFNDTIGHGTACAGIIRSVAPECQLYSVKIFNNEMLTANLNILIEAIKWAVDNGMNIINLSLGTINDGNILLLKDICDYALQKKVIIVSAISNDGQVSYPASFNNVIGVYGGNNLDNKYCYFYLSDSKVEIISHGDTQKVCWLNNDYTFIKGNSFAAPYISGIIALILEKFNNNSLSFIRSVLKDNAIPEKYEFSDVSNYKFYTKKRINYKIDWIKKACIFPFNKEMHALIRAKELLNFNIESVVDPIGKRLVGKDAGEVIGIKETGLIIEHDLNKALERADTLILSHVGELSQIIKKDLFSKIIIDALNAKKNIFCLDPLSQLTHSYLIEESYKNNVKLYSPSLKFQYDKNYLFSLFNKINFNDPSQENLFNFISNNYLFLHNLSEKYLSAIGEEIRYEELENAQNKKVKAPVIGIFGTSSHQGKFTAQLALRKMLLKSDYKISQIGTEPHCELFNFDLAFPNGYQSSINWSIEDQIKFLHYKMVEINKINEPEIIIVGAQSGIIPYNINILKTIPLPSMGFLFGTKPDAFILTVNSIDKEEFIQKTIDALKILGQSEVILLIMSDKEKIINKKFNVKINFRQLTTKEMTEKLKYLEKKFKIPATEVITEKGQEKLLNTILKFFSQ